MVKIKRLFRKGFLSSVLAASLILGGVPLNGILTPVLADTEKTITGLGTGAIVNPTEPADTSSDWSGSYVYYGKYDGTNPTKYRVLDTASADFGVEGGSLLLDCDTVLYTRTFRDDKNAQNANQWGYSDVKADINGNGFLNKTDNLTVAEKAAIAVSVKPDAASADGNGWSGSLGWAPLGKYANGSTDGYASDHIFLLDAKEATRTGYGYSNTDDNVTNRVKTGSDSKWWLRSPVSGDDPYAGEVFNVGSVIGVAVSSELGVSPAFNVNLSSIIFTSLIPGKGTSGQPGAEYKLTLKDDNMNIAVTDGKAVTRKDDTVIIPYTTTGTNAGNATQVSVLVTKDPYEAGKAVTTGVDYQKLNVGSWSTSGTGTFDLPEAYKDKTFGTEYHVYILAEDVNGEKETDYASAPVELPVPVRHTHTFTHHECKEATESADGNIEYWECSECGDLFSDAKGTHKISQEDTVIAKLKKISATATGFSGTYDGKAHGITVKVTEPSSGATVRYGTVEGTYDKNASPEYTEVGTYTVYYEVTAEGYKTLEGKETIEIKKAEEKKDEPKNEPVITPSDNKAMDVRPETVEGDYQVTYAHQIPFPGKGKLTAESFGENFTVSQGNVSYKVKKIKANKKKHRIQILKLENAPKDVEKAVKKATKGDKGIPYTQNPYYVRDTDKVTAKFKKSGATASVKVNINGKDYKAKKGEYEYNDTSKLIMFKGDNLAGSWTVK